MFNYSIINPENNDADDSDAYSQIRINLIPLSVNW